MSRRVATSTWWLALAVLLAALALAAGRPDDARATHQSVDFVNWDLVDYEVRTRPEWNHWSHTYIGQLRYRWLDTPAKVTVISSNFCSSLAFNGKNDIPSGYSGTQYHSIGSGSPGNCYQVRGRTASGTGGMYNHDGRFNW